jgi:hypothetical protein
MGGRAVRVLKLMPVSEKIDGWRGYWWNMTFSENRCALFGIMFYTQSRSVFSIPL